MNNEIEQMIDGILEREGGFVDHRSDPGGATNFGITQRVARANGFYGDMRKLPIETARDIYFKQYIVKPKYLALAEIDLVVAEEVIDSGVNAGPGRASRWLQQALNVLNRRGADYPDIAEDGDIGPATMAAFTALRRRRGAATTRKLMIRSLDGLQFMHYFSLARGNTKFEDFMPGWIAGRIGNSGH